MLELDIVSIEALFQAVLALQFGLVWRRNHDAGMGQLSAGFALTALWYGWGSRVPYDGATIHGTELRLSAIVIGVAVLFIARGSADYLGMPTGPARWLVSGASAPGVLAILAIALGLELEHRTFHLAVLPAYLGPAGLAFRRDGTDPGEAHGVVGTALLLLATLPVLLLLLDAPAHDLVQIAGVAVTLFGMGLLTVHLLRRQRALQTEIALRTEAEQGVREMNTLLEAQVAERTAHLGEIVASLEAFNRNVSHDLRGPLGGMSQLARLAEQSLAKGDLELPRRALPAIAHQCEESVEMVNALLQLARIGRVPLSAQVVGVRELVADAHQAVMLAAGAGAPPILLPELDAKVVADPPLLRTAIVNLLSNAVKFSHGLPDAHVSVSTRTEPGFVVIRVEDNGPGFDPRHAEQLFQPFFRAPGSNRPGHGLGLAMVRRAVEAMGGTVWAEGVPGAGAAFSIRLRCAPSGR